MKVSEQVDAASLWQLAEGLLSRDPANNTHQLSAMKRMLDLGAHDGQRFFSIATDGEIAGSAVRVDTKTLFLSVMADDAAALLGDHLREQIVELAGVIGRRSTLSAFTPAFRRDYKVHVELLLYQLYGKPDPGNATGSPRVATPGDLELLVEWHRAFENEVHMIDVPTLLEERVARRIGDGQLVLWTDGGSPVSFAGGNELPAASARIGPVYTPPALRGRGYAQAVTAAASMQVQYDQPRTVFLFTDAANPASNVCYQRIGYRHIADHAHLLF